jgi:hypothetical protein
VRGGGVRLCRLVYRSPRVGWFRRLMKMVVPATRIVKGTPTAAGVLVGRRVDRARTSRGASRRRASILGRRSLGCVPGRCFFIVVFILASTSGIYCGSLQSIFAMGLLQIWGTGVFFDIGGRRFNGGGRRRFLPIWGFTGSTVLSVISFFVKGLCVRWFRQLSCILHLCTCIRTRILYSFLDQ